PTAKADPPMNTTTRLFVASLSFALLPTLARADFIDGQVRNSLGQGVPNVDINVYFPGSNNQPSISNDGTDANGFFPTTLPAGTWDIAVQAPQPPLSNGLITMLPGVVVSGTTNMGVVTLTPGAALSGHVINSVGGAVPGIDLDVLDAAGNNVLLQYDSTDSFGN